MIAELLSMLPLLDCYSGIEMSKEQMQLYYNVQCSIPLEKFNE